MHDNRLARSIKRAVALSLATVLLSAVPAFAEPTTADITVGADTATTDFRTKLADKQAALAEYNAQLDDLDRQLEIASEEYNAALAQLETMNGKVESAQTDLSNTQEAVALQSSILGKRAAALYKDDSLSAIELLLDSSSVYDFVTRVKFLNTIGMRDADITASLRGQQVLLEQQLSTLRNDRAEAKSIEFEAKARRVEILMRVQERETLVAAAQAEISKLLEEEAARRQSDQAALLQEVLSGANAKGIVVEAGSPVETALAYHGVPYVWGGETPAGFDCSGLMLYVFEQHGVTLPHYSGSQFQLGTKVSVTDLQPGDVVFFGSPIHHVGLYIGGGYYLHAPRTGDFVKISKLADRNDFAGARRYDWQYRTAAIKNVQTSTLTALDSVD